MLEQKQFNIKSQCFYEIYINSRQLYFNIFDLTFIKIIQYLYLIKFDPFKKISKCPFSQVYYLYFNFKVPKSLQYLSYKSLRNLPIQHHPLSMSHQNLPKQSQPFPTQLHPLQTNLHPHYHQQTIQTSQKQNPSTNRYDELTQTASLQQYAEQKQKQDTKFQEYFQEVQEIGKQELFEEKQQIQSPEQTQQPEIQQEKVQQAQSTVIQHVIGKYTFKFPSKLVKSQFLQLLTEQQTKILELKQLKITNLNLQKHTLWQKVHKHIKTSQIILFHFECLQQVSILKNIEPIIFPHLLYLNLMSIALTNIESLSFLNAVQLKQINLNFNHFTSTQSLNKINLHKLQKLSLCINKINEYQVSRIRFCETKIEFIVMFNDYYQTLNDLSFISKLQSIKNKKRNKQNYMNMLANFYLFNYDGRFPLNQQLVESLKRKIQ